MMPETIVVGHQLARFHHRLGLQPDRAARLDRGAQHVAGRELDHAAVRVEPARLGALARARRPQQDDIHAALSLAAFASRRA